MSISLVTTQSHAIEGDMSCAQPAQTGFVAGLKNAVDRISTLTRMLSELSDGSNPVIDSFEGSESWNRGEDARQKVDDLFRDALCREIEQALQREAEEWAHSVVSEMIGDDEPIAQAVAPVEHGEGVLPGQGVVDGKMSLGGGAPSTPLDGAAQLSEYSDSISQKEREVLSYLIEHPDATQTELAESLFISRSTVAGYTVSLQAKGFLSRLGSRRQGRWVVLL